MKIKRLLFVEILDQLKYFIKYICLFLALFLVSYKMQAQNTTTADSMRQANQMRIDSIREAQKIRQDSLIALRAYKATKGYKDSVARVKQLRLEEMAKERTRIMDSVRGVMKRNQDSIVAINRAIMDSVRAVNDSIKFVQKQEMERQQAIRKRISDSMALIRAYKQSQGYKDSVAAVNQQRLDSMKAARAAYNDSVRTEQRRVLDSITAERKKFNDSLRTAQKALNDSIKTERLRVADSMRTSLDSIRAEMARVRDSAMAARKVITDSLAKIREEKAKAREVVTKEKEKKKKLQLEIKLEKEKQAFTNESQRKKKWGFPRKVLQNTYTRYNYYFNANNKLKEAELNMQRLKKDSFNNLITLFPFNPDVDSARLKSDMDTIIQKTSLGIQLHDPRSKWQDDLYLIMGQAYYYKGDYENAANAFKFIVHQTEKERKEKMKKNKSDKKEELAQNSFAEIEPEGFKALLKHSPAKNEAILWLARVLVKQKDPTVAVLLLDMLKNDVNFPTHLKDRLALEYANLALETGKPQNAMDPLGQLLVSNEIDKYTRRRAGYIQGQILQSNNELEKSTQAFEQVVALFPALDMDFNARMNIVKNNIATANTDEKNYETLVKMSKDDKFKPYFDQVYFALGKHFEGNDDQEQAIANYEKSIAYSDNNPLQRGLTYVGLGDMYYKDSEHVKAAEKYDSATQFLTVTDQPVYAHATKRATLLYQVATPAAVVKISDSLLQLSAMPEAEQRTYIKKYLKALEKASVDSYYASLKPTNIAPVMPGGGGAKSWYFANPSAMQKGATEFKQKWPNRELKDNWRRSVSSGGFSMSEDDAIVEENLTPEEKIRNNLPNEDSLFAAIPRMPQHLDTLTKNREEGLYTLGKNYFYHLEDYDNTVKSFGRLDSLYPNNRFIPETYYIKYLINMRQQRPQEAEKYYNYLLSNYPNSNYTIMVQQALSGGEGDSTQNIDKHYDATYNMIMNSNYEQGLQQVEKAYTQFPVLGEYRKQYDLLRVVGIAGMGDFVKASGFIEEWLKSYPTDSLTNYAKTIRDYILRNKIIQEDLIKKQAEEDKKTMDAQNAKDGGVVTETAKDGTEPEKEQTGTENPPKPEDGPKSVFSAPSKSAPHYMIIVLPLDNRIQGIKAGLSEYNKITSGHEQIAVTLNSLTVENSIVLSKQFNGQQEAQDYLNKVKKLTSLFQEYPQMKGVQMAIITVDNYGKLLATKDAKAYLDFAKKNYK